MIFELCISTLTETNRHQSQDGLEKAKQLVTDLLNTIKNDIEGQRAMQRAALPPNPYMYMARPGYPGYPPMNTVSYSVIRVSMITDILNRVTLSLALLLLELCILVMVEWHMHLDLPLLHLKVIMEMRVRLLRLLHLQRMITTLYRLHPYKFWIFSSSQISKL